MSCTKCNNAPVDCGQPCGCSYTCDIPFLDVSEVPDSISVLRFNINGYSAEYDFGNMIYQQQTDTKVSINAVKRVLKYMAERHTDSISAKELGSILHIADIGDVDISDATDNSLFVYKKNNDCAHDCVGIDNSWIAWNAKDNISPSLNTIMGFDEKDAPRSLLQPANPNQFYVLGWNTNNKVGYHQPQERSLGSISISEGGKKYAYQLFLDPSTKELVYAKVEVNV